MNEWMHKRLNAIHNDKWMHEWMTEWKKEQEIMKGSMKIRKGRNKERMHECKQGMTEDWRHERMKLIMNE